MSDEMILNRLKKLTLVFFLGLTVCSLLVYFIARVFTFVISDYSWSDKYVALLLLLAEVFTLIHSLGYLRNLFKVALKKNSEESIDVGELTNYPEIAIIVSSLREPLDILEDTLICFHNLTYPNKAIYLLDDTRYDLPKYSPEEHAVYRANIEQLCQSIGINLFRRRWRGAKAGMINDFLAFVTNNPKEGFEYTNYTAAEKPSTPKYIIVFDADQHPLPDFAENLIAILEENPKLAFVQTPQYYTNFFDNRVARAAGLQQAVFFEYICEGKGEQNAMFCCGTNVVFRTTSLIDVGGLDECSVTEDFATSLHFHLKGWQSKYVTKVCAFGMGPEDLGAFFKQQFRWALGCISNTRNILSAFIRHPYALPLSLWWEYMLSGTYYLVGWTFFIMVMSPVLFIFTNVPTYFSYPVFYALFFIPYFLLSFCVFFGTLARRRYNTSGIYSGMLLIAVTFPVYMMAAVYGLSGIKGTFNVTPKGGAQILPLKFLVVQLGIALLTLSAATWALCRALFEQDNVAALLLNTCWCMYFFGVLSSVLYFNNPNGR